MQILNEVNFVDHSHKGSFADRQKLTPPSIYALYFQNFLYNIGSLNAWNFFQSVETSLYFSYYSRHYAWSKDIIF